MADNRIKGITAEIGGDTTKLHLFPWQPFSDENWNIQDIDVKTRSIITVVALIFSGITGRPLIYHLNNAKAHGVTPKEIAAIIAHIAFYAGWPKRYFYRRG